jgi:hypothetical protein
VQHFGEEVARTAVAQLEHQPCHVGPRTSRARKRERRTRRQQEQSGSLAAPQPHVERVGAERGLRQLMLEVPRDEREERGGGEEDRRNDEHAPPVPEEAPDDDGCRGDRPREPEAEPPPHERLVRSRVAVDLDEVARALETARGKRGEDCGGEQAEGPDRDRVAGDRRAAVEPRLEPLAGRHERGVRDERRTCDGAHEADRERERGADAGICPFPYEPGEAGGDEQGPGVAPRPLQPETEPGEHE